MEPIELRLGGNGRVLSRGVIGRMGDNQFIEYPFQLFMPDGTPQDLNGCSVIFYGTNPNGKFTSGTPEIIDSSTGKISYKFNAENFSARGEFKEAFFRVTKENGERYATQSFRLKIENDADLTQGQAQLYVSLLDEKLKDFDEQFVAFIEEKEQQYQTLSDEISNLETGLEDSNKTLSILEDKLDQTNQQIGDLGKLKKMYANSIDFGDYDYSGNPNLFLNDLIPSSFINGAGLSVEKYNNGLKYTFPVSETALFSTQTTTSVTSVLPSTKYTWSLDFTVDEGFAGDLSSIRITWRKEPGGGVIFELNPTNDIAAGKKTKIELTTTTPATVSEFKRFYLAISTLVTDPDKVPFSGTFKIENIKLEKSDTATPYQPNLLEEPYYLSKASLGENIADPTQAFPINTQEFQLYEGRLKDNEKWEAGQRYVIWIKGTKPSSQTFTVYLNDEGAEAVTPGILSPIEGLANVWAIHFTVTQEHVDKGITNNLLLFQAPYTSVGDVKIENLKIEKGDVATPSLSMFKYFGEGLKDSNDPTDYSWDITPEYAEKTMNNAVNVHDPQEIEGLKNFVDGLQVGGENILPIEDTGWVDLTANTGYSWGKQAQVRKIGKHIMWRGALAGTTTLGDVTKLPSGFEPGGGYEMQFDLPRQSSDPTQKARIYVRTDGTVGLIASTSETSNIFLSGISYFVE